jgi:hypothetical protein
LGYSGHEDDQYPHDEVSQEGERAMQEKHFDGRDSTPATVVTDAGDFSNGVRRYTQGGYQGDVEYDRLVKVDFPQSVGHEYAGSVRKSDQGEDETSQYIH